MQSLKQYNLQQGRTSREDPSQLQTPQNRPPDGELARLISIREEARNHLFAAEELKTPELKTPKDSPEYQQPKANPPKQLRLYAIECDSMMTRESPPSSQNCKTQTIPKTQDLYDTDSPFLAPISVSLAPVLR
jgi:hypothetical protein